MRTLANVAAVGMVLLCAAGADAAQVEERLEVIADEAEIVVAGKVVARAKKGEKLTRVRWIAVEIERDGKLIRGWVRADQVAAVGGAPVTPDEPDVAGANPIGSHAQRVKLLEMVFAKPRAWSEHRLSLERGHVKVTRRQISQMRKVLNARATWPAKVNALALITPLDVRVYCDPDGMVPIKEVVDAFGEPEKRTDGVICNIPKFNPRPVEAARGKTDIKGTWYRYGSVRLGVTDQGEILVIQVFGPQWRDERKAWEKTGQ